MIYSEVTGKSAKEGEDYETTVESRRTREVNRINSKYAEIIPVPLSL
jgi:hypothetical protein